MTISPSSGADDVGLIRLGPPTARERLVLLHGWGADADDLLELGRLLVGPEVSVVALQAPLPHPAGVGRQWYDLQQPGWPQLPVARSQLRQRLVALDGELSLRQTVLLGFSQGAAMALDVATGAGGLPVAGLIGCSGYPIPTGHPSRGGAQRCCSAMAARIPWCHTRPVKRCGSSFREPARRWSCWSSTAAMRSTPACFRPSASSLTTAGKAQLGGAWSRR
jgi:predicted esterase